MAEKCPLDRREMLKASGVGLATLASGAGPVGTTDDKMTEEEAEEILSRAQTTLREDGPEARARYLRGEGIRSTYTGGTTSVKYTSRNSIHAQDIECIEPNRCDDGEIEVNISIDYLRKLGYYYVSLRTRYKYNYWDRGRRSGYYDDTPQRPRDRIRFYWDSGEWELNTPEYPRESVFPPDYGSWDDESWIRGEGGTGFLVNDRRVCIQSGTTERHGDKEWSQWARCGVQLAPGPEHTESSAVSGEYCHTWNAQSPPLSVTTNSRTGVRISLLDDPLTKKEKLATTLEGKSLTITASEW
jgi:hypothetical protein